MSLLHDGPSGDPIPAASVDDLLRTVRIGLQQLDLELQQSELEIAELERELSTHAELQPDDPRIDIARGAVEGVAVGAQEHLDRMLAAAHAHAEARIAAAEAEASWILQAAREDLARAVVRPLGVGDPVPSVDPTLQTAPEPPQLDHLTGWAPAAISPPLPTVPPSPRPPEPVEPASTPPAEPAVDTVADQAFWADAPTRRRPPSNDLAMAFLPMGAIVLLLVAVLLLIG